MAREEASAQGKRLKISRAQQYMLLAVLGAGIVFGVSAAVVLHFVDLIGFNARVIMAKDEAIVAYSDTIKNIGICKKPKGQVYSDSELKACNPNMTDVSDVPGTLRYNILNNLVADPSLNSVQRRDDSSCVNPSTNKSYTYKELNEIYDNAISTDEIASATALIKSCSALRVVPDALPAQKNEEALLASLDKIFILSGQRPESLSPTGEKSEVDTTGLNTIMLNIKIDSGVNNVYAVLKNIERSIRSINLEQATLEWSGENSITFGAQAAAYYVDAYELVEVSKTIMANGGSKK